jgi:hypothetical protein
MEGEEEKAHKSPEKAQKIHYKKGLFNESHTLLEWAVILNLPLIGGVLLAWLLFKILTDWLHLI